MMREWYLKPLINPTWQGNPVRSNRDEASRGSKDSGEAFFILGTVERSFFYPIFLEVMQ